jgi:hypothetical protein
MNLRPASLVIATKLSVSTLGGFSKCFGRPTVRHIPTLGSWAIEMFRDHSNDPQGFRSSMADTRREAAHLRVALQFGLVTVADVVSWSDSNAQESDRPAPAFLELSSMWKAHPLDVLHVLRSMSEDVPANQVLP